MGIIRELVYRFCGEISAEQLIQQGMQVEKNLKGKFVNILLLTGTIKPFIEVVHNDPQIRLQEYTDVIKRYICYSNFDGIVFAENSGYPFEIDCLVDLANEYGKVFEYLDLSDEVDKRNMSSAEAVLMKNALIRSKLLVGEDKAKRIWKSTGRVYINNVNKILQEHGTDENANIFLYSKQYDSIQTWFFCAKVDDLTKYFLSDETIENMSESCIEYAWMECYRKNKEQITISSFTRFPDAEGVRSSGQKYTASLLKKIIRNILLKCGWFTIR